MYWRRIRLAKGSKPRKSCRQSFVLFVTAVGTNLSPLNSTLTWVSVSGWLLRNLSFSPLSLAVRLFPDAFLRFCPVYFSKCLCWYCGQLLKSQRTHRYGVHLVYLITCEQSNPLDKQLEYDKNTGKITKWYLQPYNKVDEIAARYDAPFVSKQDARVREPGLLLVHKMIERRGKMCTMQ